MRSSPIRLLLLLLVLAFGPGLASAASVLQLDVPAHVADSTAVVEATVQTAEESVDPATGRPVTDTAVTVTAVLAGAAPERLAVRQHKGTAGELTYGIPGDGDLVEGARVVLFLHQAEGQWWLTALGQSVWTVKGSGDDAAVSQDLDGLAFFTLDVETGAFLPTEPTPGPRTLGALRAAVKAAGEGR